MFSCPCGYESKYKGNVVKHKRRCGFLKDEEFRKEIRELKNIIEKKDELIEKLRNQNMKFMEEQNDRLLEKMKEQSDKLIDKIQPHTTNHTTNNRITIINNKLEQLEPLVFNELPRFTDELECEHLESAKTVAQYALDYPFKDKICCVDIARQKIKYKDDITGEIKTDPKMKLLSEVLLQSLEVSAGVNMNELCGKSEKERKKFRKELVDICCAATAI